MTDTVMISRDLAQRLAFMMQRNSGNRLSPIKPLLDELKAVLSSPPPPSWVNVDESHPLPDSWEIGDEILQRVEKYQYKTTHYRRRPSAEQGG